MVVVLGLLEVLEYLRNLLQRFWDQSYWVEWIRYEKVIKVSCLKRIFLCYLVIGCSS